MDVARGKEGDDALLSLWYSHRKLQFFRVERFLEGSSAARISTDRYSLKANPDKLVHLLLFSSATWPFLISVVHTYSRKHSHIIGNHVADQIYFTDFDDRDNQLKSCHKLSFVFLSPLYQQTFTIASSLFTFDVKLCKFVERTYYVHIAAVIKVISEYICIHIS